MRCSGAWNCAMGVFNLALLRRSGTYTTRLFKVTFSHLLSSRIYKAVVLVGWLLYIAAGITGCFYVVEGLNPKHLVPTENYLHKYSKTSMKHAPHLHQFFLQLLRSFDRVLESRAATARNSAKCARPIQVRVATAHQPTGRGVRDAATLRLRPQRHHVLAALLLRLLEVDQRQVREYDRFVVSQSHSSCASSRAATAS